MDEKKKKVFHDWWQYHELEIMIDLFLQRGLEDIAPIKKKKQEAKKEVFTEN